jgi:hypothetical protein
VCGSGCRQYAPGDPPPLVQTVQVDCGGCGKIIARIAPDWTKVFCSGCKHITERK